MPPKKTSPAKTGATSMNKQASTTNKTPQKSSATKTTNEPVAAAATVAAAAAAAPPPPMPVKDVKMKEVVPREMEKLRDLTRWPIVMDEVGNLKTFYRMNETILEFSPPLTAKRVQVALQHVFFGLTFNADGSINDHRQYTMPNDANRLVAVIMEDKLIEVYVEELRRVCSEIHPDLFDTVFLKANEKESGRSDLDRLFMLTKTPDEIRQSDYYQLTAKNRSEIPFTCVWITERSEIPAAYENVFGPRYRIS